ncbi:MAG: cupin domain-containing protein [Variovorax sp.]|nr:cupin domain-containing protein [Variovorax sp.]
MSTSAELEALYAKIYGLHMEGGWHRKAPALWPEPRANFHPNLWRYRDVKPILEQAGGLVDHRMADRRNLTMTNPVEGNLYSTVRTLVAAYQSIKPGEQAEAHRHTPSALRIILEGQRSFTVVNGTRVEMRPGDVLLTPSWSWHSHEAVGPDDCFWVDVLDVPLVHLLEPMFFERHPDKFEAQVSDAQEAPIAFRWTDSLRRLDASAAAPAHGTAEREIELGAPAMKTIAIHVQRMSAGFASATHRSTANAIYTVLDGEGTTRAGEREMHWQLGDVFAVPAWQAYRHEVSRDAHLVRVSDEPVMRAFDLLREQNL